MKRPFSSFVICLLVLHTFACKASEKSSGVAPSGTFPKSDTTIQLTITQAYGIKTLRPVPSTHGTAFLFGGSQGLFFYTDGKIRQASKDLMQSFDLGEFGFADGSSSDILVGLYRGDNVLRAFKSNDTFALQPISAGDIPASVDQITDIRLYKNEGQLRGVVTGQRGQLEHWRFYDPGWGQTDGTVLRTQYAPFPGQFLSLIGQTLCGSSPNKGVWCMDLNEVPGQNLRKLEFSKAQAKEKVSIKGFTLLDDSRCLTVFSDRKIEIRSTDKFKLLQSFLITGADMVEWVPAGVWATYPQGCLIMLYKMPDKGQLHLIDGKHFSH